MKANSGVILSAAKDLSYLRDVCRICEVPRFTRDDMARAEGAAVWEWHVFKFAQRMKATHTGAQRRGYRGSVKRPQVLGFLNSLLIAARSGKSRPVGTAGRPRPDSY